MTCQLPTRDEHAIKNNILAASTRMPRQFAVMTQDGVWVVGAVRLVDVLRAAAAMHESALQSFFLDSGDLYAALTADVQLYRRDALAAALVVLLLGDAGDRDIRPAVDRWFGRLGSVAMSINRFARASLLSV